MQEILEISRKNVTDWDSRHTTSAGLGNKFSGIPDGVQQVSKVPGGAGPSGARPILDTSLRQSGELSVGRVFNWRNRRMWSRAIWGMKLPGRYYFLTFTTVPTSPPLRSLWDGLRKWLKYHRPGICWLYCFTLEGGLYRYGGGGPGVIHMVIRLGHRQKNVDVKELRAMWKDRSGASQIVIKRVPECKKEDLISYLVNQKIKTGMACELGYQSAVTRWHWSSGWLPKGYTRRHSKVWRQFIDAPAEMRLKAVNDLLHIMFEKDRKT